MAPAVVRFGAYEVDTAKGELRKNGLKIKLQEQPLRILLHLLERPGEVVTREELRARLWSDDTFVEFDKALSTATNKLREALCDEAGNPRFVETVPRRGYRFIAPVQSSSTPAHKDRSAPRWWLAAILLMLMGVAALVVAISGIVRPARHPQIHSIAVLPMANLSHDPEQEFFSDGMTDAVITELARIGDLRVISRQSVMRYKGSAAPLREIATTLNVDAVLEGTVLRSGDRVRVTAQLLQTASDSHLWAQQYDRDLRDVLSLQADIAHSIAEEVRVRLTPEERALLAKSRPAVNPRAYELYLRGYKEWYKLTNTGLRDSAAYFEQSLQVDPRYAPAYVGLANSYAVLGQQEILPPSQAYARAREGALKALQLDGLLGDAHAALGWVRRNYDWDWRGAEQEFRVAVRLSPGSAPAHFGYSAYLNAMGREQEALRELHSALDLDPLSSFYAAQLGLVLIDHEEYEEANKWLQRALEFDPGNLRAHYGLGEMHAAKGEYDDAIRELRGAVELPGGRLDVVARLAQLYVQTGQRSKARALLSEVKSLAARRHVSPLDLAGLYAVLGYKDEAFAELEEAYKQRSPFLINIRKNRTLDNLRSDSRFSDLLHRIGVPQ